MRVNDLKAEIARNGLNITTFAIKMGFSRVTAHKKINGKIEFKASEIVKAQKILNLSNEKRDYIFLEG